MSAPIKKIQTWLEALASRPDVVDPEIVLYTTNGVKKSPIWNSDKRWRIEDTVQQILDSAEGAANGVPGISRFLLQAYHPESRRTDPIATTGFALSPRDDSGSEVLSETPDMQGLLAQLMRHNETMHRQSSGTFGLMFQHLTKINEQLSEKLTRLESERAQQTEAMEALLTQKHERDIEMKQVEEGERRKSEMFGKIMQLLPVAVNKLAGKELIRQKDTTLELLASELTNSITPEKLDLLMQSGAFDRHQVALILSMIEQVSQRMVTPEQKQEEQKGAADAIFSTIGALASATAGGGGGNP